jgi:hypothetical protein
MYYYAQDAVAITLEAGDVVDSQRNGLLIETPEEIVQINLPGDGWIYAGFADGSERRFRTEARVKIYGGTKD